MKIAPTHARRGSALGALPMTSMIDVVFLLLVFFLVTSSFSQSEGRLSAAARPQSDAPATSDLAPQIVDVTIRNGRDTFVLGERATHDARQLTAWLQELPKDQGVAVRVSGDASVASAAQALQSAQDAGFTKRNYVAAID